MSRKAEEVARRLMHDRLEAAMLSALRGTHTNTAAEPPQPTLTLAKLQDMLDAMPPRETWAVSRLFPPNCATIVKTPDENLTCINDGTWARLEPELRRAIPIEKRGNPFYEIRPSFIDPDRFDTPEHAEWRAKERKRILDRMAATMAAHVELKRVVEAWWRRI